MGFIYPPVADVAQNQPVAAAAPATPPAPGFSWVRWLAAAVLMAVVIWLAVVVAGVSVDHLLAGHKWWSPVQPNGWMW